MARIVGAEEDGECRRKDNRRRRSTNRLMYQVVRTFRNDLIQADEILLGRAKDDKGEPIERFVGVGKLCGEVLPQLEAFLKVQNNAEIVLMMILEIIKAQRLVEEHGEGEWLRPLKRILGDDLYEQILAAGAA